MKKLLGLFLCACALMVLSLGTTGCTTKKTADKKAEKKGEEKKAEKAEEKKAEEKKSSSIQFQSQPIASARSAAELVALNQREVARQIRRE